MQVVEKLLEKFVPENYSLFLNINRKDMVFEGSVNIQGEALAETISLHQKDLEIAVVKSGDFNLPFKVNNELDLIEIDLRATGKIELFVKFYGKITDNMVGIYPSYYSENGVGKMIISTQLESHFARQVFPCIDEPSAKASFDLSICFDDSNSSDSNDIVISNMPEIDVENRKNSGIWKFARTPKMSSYLLAFAIGELQSIKDVTKNGTEVAVFSTKLHKVKSMEFALEVATKSIEFYEDYFGVNYPIPQSYHLALPDFSAGAMENWGLVTYREVNLLVDDNSTVNSRQQVALVIAHEVSHQWFGNLVTMAWWDDLWLNESFANMMEYVAVDSIRPSWNIIEHFQTTGVGLALNRDATAGVQSVHIDVNHPDEINSIFDPAIVYAKGSRLMHMLRRWLGDEVFSKGLSSYFQKFKYKNTIGKNLWNELNKASGKDVETFMEGWLEQSGYPVLDVKVENDNLIISQKQFFIGEKDDIKRLWLVPLNSNWAGTPDIVIPDTLIEEKLVIPNYSKLKSKNNCAFRLNTDNTAHYIVNYQGELFDDILKEFDKLNKISKLQLLQDLKLLAEGNKIDYSKLINLLPLLKNEDSYIVNSEISKILSNIKKFIDEDNEVEKAFKKITRNIFQANFDNLGFITKNGETDNEEIVRQITLSSMIYADDTKAIKEASQIFKKYENNLEEIPAPIRAIVLANQIKNYETQNLVDKYLKLYAKTLDFNLKRELSLALSETRSEETLEKILSTLKDKNIVKPQDLAISWYRPLLSKPFTQSKIWNWSCQNWSWITKSLGDDMNFDKFVLYPAMYFKTQNQLSQYKTFFTPQLSNIAISRSIKMGITEIQARVALLEKNKKAVETEILNLTP